MNRIADVITFLKKKIKKNDETFIPRHFPGKQTGSSDAAPPCLLFKVMFELENALLSSKEFHVLWCRSRGTSDSIRHKDDPSHECQT